MATPVDDYTSLKETDVSVLCFVVGKDIEWAL